MTNETPIKNFRLTTADLNNMVTALGQTNMVPACIDALAKTAGDFRWFGLLSLMVQYNSQDGTNADQKK